jgi:hypothetical protein
MEKIEQDILNKVTEAAAATERDIEYNLWK